MEIVTKLGRPNTRSDHLSRILTREEVANIDENFPNAQLVAVDMVDDSFTKIVQSLSI